MPYWNTLLLDNVILQRLSEFNFNYIMGLTVLTKFCGSG